MKATYTFGNYSVERNSNKRLRGGIWLLPRHSRLGRPKSHDDVEPSHRQEYKTTKPKNCGPREAETGDTSETLETAVGRHVGGAVRGAAWETLKLKE